MQSLSRLALSFFLVSMAATDLMATSEPIFDVNGEKVYSGADYYLIGIKNGGLTVCKGANGTCPSHIYQLKYDFLTGAPMTFFPANDYDGNVYTSTDVIIKFTYNSSKCDESRVWKVENYDDSKGHWYITTNGVKGYPGPHTLRNWFKFERGYTNVYKIVYCPSVCKWCVKLCTNVGPYDGHRNLVLSKSEFWVKFVKVTKELQNVKKLSTI